MDGWWVEKLQNLIYISTEVCGGTRPNKELLYCVIVIVLKLLVFDVMKALEQETCKLYKEETQYLTASHAQQYIRHCVKRARGKLLRLLVSRALFISKHSSKVI